MKLVVVFDTSVLVSALGWGGKPGQRVRLARDGTIDGITCPEILHELTNVLSAKLTWNAERIVEVVGSLELFLRPVTIAGKVSGISADPTDEKILECATAGGASHIVTSDKKHLLPIRNFQGIEIVLPSDLLRIAQAT